MAEVSTPHSIQDDFATVRQGLEHGGAPWADFPMGDIYEGWIAALSRIEEQLEAQEQMLNDVRRALSIDDMSQNDHEAGLTSEETLGFIREAVSNPASSPLRTHDAGMAQSPSKEGAR